MTRQGIIFDVDGTLVDTVYQHARAWVAAFDSVGVVVPVFRIHRAIGMESEIAIASVPASAPCVD